MSKRERALYEKIIEIQAEEITTLRLQIGLVSAPAVQRKEEDPPKTAIYQDFHVASDLEEDLEWQLETGRISLDEFENKMRGYGVELAPVETT